MKSLVHKVKNGTLIGVPLKNLRHEAVEPDWYIVVASGWFLVAKDCAATDETPCQPLPVCA